MPITSQQLLQTLPNAGTKVGVFVPVLNTAMQRFQIVGANALPRSSLRSATNPASWSTSARSGDQPRPSADMKAGKT